MGWLTTSDLDRFAAAAGRYLRSRAAENTLLLSAAQAAGAGRPPRAPALPPVLFGWWEPAGGGEPRGAFVHDPSAPLLISGRTPETAAALAVALTKLGRAVTGVDAPPEAADAFAAAWSQRAGTAVRVHRTCRVYRLAGGPPGAPLPETPAQRAFTRATPAQGMPVVPGAAGWPPGGAPGPAGRLRVATAEDKGLLADWLTAFAAEAAERLGSAADVAADLIGYDGAVFWEVPHQPGRFRDSYQPVTLATLTRPVAGVVRVAKLYTPPEYRRNSYATALTLAVGRALVADGGPGAAPRHARGALSAMSRQVNEVVMITDKNRSDRWSRLGYQLVSERAVLRFGPVTGPVPRPQLSGGMPRLPTGPLPRLPRLRR